MSTCDFDYHHANKSARFDGRGIFLTYVCDKCERAKMAEFRADILDLYDADEPIEGDDY